MEVKFCCSYHGIDLETLGSRDRMTGVGTGKINLLFRLQSHYNGAVTRW